MEIRNALQKIDNYLNVVANLNKTILLEGTMSKDELLLMKKYLYTSIDRIEDIEKLLFIEQHDNKSFVPSEVSELANKIVSAQKEIVEVEETDHFEDVEAVLTNEQKTEMEEMVEAIKLENETEVQAITENIEVVNVEAPIELNETQQNSEVINTENEIKTDDIVETIEASKIEETVMSLVAEENIELTSEQDDIINFDKEKIEVVNEIKQEEIPVVNDIVEAKEAIVNENIVQVENEIPKVEEIKEPTIFAEEKIDLIAELPTENIVAEIPTVTNTLVDEKNDLNDIIQEKEESVFVSATNKVESNNKLIDDEEKEEIPLFNKLTPFKEETVLAKFTQQSSSFADTFINKEKENSLEDKKEEVEAKVEIAQPNLFQLTDEKDDELISFTPKSETTIKNNVESFDTSASVLKQSANVLVAEEDEETTIEQLTPSFINTEYNKKTVADILSNKIGKSLSESITLNDKFIFVRELFGNQFAEYEAALKHLDNMQDAVTAENYCNNNLWNKFNWTERGSVAARFIDVIKKKFN